MKEYDQLIWTQKQDIISSVYRQEFILHKFKESKRFIEMVKDLRISKSTNTLNNYF